MKKFKNITSYLEATQYIENAFEVPVSEMELAADEELVIGQIIWLFDNAKNSAVRAAIHHYALGSTVYLDTSEEREVLEDIHYNGMFCEYFNQSKFYAQLKCYDGSAKSGRVCTSIDTYFVDDMGVEYYTHENILKMFDLE